MSVKAEKLHAKLMDVPARVDLIVHLRTMVVDGSADTVVEDLFEDMEEDVLRKLWPNVPEDDLQSFLDGDMDDIGMLIDDHKLFGFLVRISTPLVNKYGGYSWGYYTSKLVYADTFDGAVRAGLAWATAEHQKRSDR